MTDATNVRSEITCPTSATGPGGTPHSIVGCGSSNVVEDHAEPGMYDCLDCGVFFLASEEMIP